MKIKRIFAKDMRQALRLVREEHGPDAVILSNRTVNGGVEVVSAIDFDQAEIEQALARQKQAANPPPAAPANPGINARANSVANAGINPGVNPGPGASQEAAAAAPARTFARHLRRMSAPAPATAANPPPARQRIDIHLNDDLDDELSAKLDIASEARLHSGMSVAEQRHGNHDTHTRKPARSPLADVEWTQEPAMREMRGELKTLRSLFENQLNLMDWQQRGQKHPGEMLLLKSLTELGFGSDVCRQVAAKVGHEHGPELAFRQAVSMITRHIKVTGDDILEHGGVVAMIGPTGVGKTTTVAKLAARFALRHGRQHVALVSTDNFRIGAQDQLRNFGRILCVPIHTANNAEELAEVLRGFADKRLVLIDTAGMSQRDLRLAEQFATLTSQKRPIRNYLVLSASTQLATMSETVRAYKQAGLSGCVLTKLDEAASLGPALSVMLKHKLPVAYLGVGQRVPEDLQTARSDKLVQRAVSMMQDKPLPVDDDDLALAFGSRAM